MLLTPAQIKPKSFELRQTLFILPRVDASHVYMCAKALGCFHSLISTQTFQRALTASVDSCTEIKSAPSLALLNLAEFGGRCQEVVLECVCIYDLVPKGAHARGYALQLKIKHCSKMFLFEILCCVLAWMNEYIVQIISATRLWLISRYSHHTLKKHWKMTAKNGHPCTEWFLSLCLQTNHKHMEKQSLICMRKTSFYTDNITSTLTIVVFSIN